MKIALIIVIGIHCIIHVLGFLKAFNISELRGISKPISKTHGVYWLTTFLLFAVTVILLLVNSDLWWISSFFALLLSQFLIFRYWADAKYGTAANLVILLATLIGYSDFNFNHKIYDERITLLENSIVDNQGIVTEDQLKNLPPIVQKWLTNSGIVGLSYIHNVHLYQDVQLKMTPDQPNWSAGKAEQYFTIQPPAFNWNINTEMNSILSVVGRDKFEYGEGEMTIQLFSLIPVVNAKNEKKLNQATLQRYLAEIVWFPSAALEKYINWEIVDDYSAKATMSYKGIEGSGIFHFDDNGIFEKFIAMRYQDASDTEPTQWTVTAKKVEERNGVKIPIECEASWQLETGDWTWLKLNITNIEYNIKEVK